MLHDYEVDYVSRVAEMEFGMKRIFVCPYYSRMKEV